MTNLTAHKLLEACREQSCPICRLEQQDVERYLDRRFYESVNSPAWRDSLRASLGFCHEHAWLAVDQRLGDALGISIIYRDIVNSVLKQLDAGSSSTPASRRGVSLPGKIPEQMRNMIEKVLSALTPHKPCPVCEHRDEMTRNALSVLVKELPGSEMTEALQASDGLCLPHLRMTFELIKDVSAHEKLLTIHRAKLEGLRAELAEFIRKNDYQAIKEGFGREGDAWLRAVRMIAGSKKEK
ncbi:MAG TPA: DUF6062 family protein [Anaerolineales bacterium]|nr:DUF6062 family protein [Anaerolineales bacterium]